MIVITHRQALHLSEVFNQGTLGLPTSNPPPLVLRADPKAGLRVRHHHGGTAVEAVIPGMRRPPETIVLPLASLRLLAKPSDAPVTLRMGQPAVAEVEWQTAYRLYSEDHPVPSYRTLEKFPKEPTLWAAAPADLADAFATAGSCGGLVLRLGGDDPAIRDEDGVETALPDGFRWPWAGDVFVGAAPVFASRQIPRDADGHVGRTPSHVVLRFGFWTIWLRQRINPGA